MHIVIRPQHETDETADAGFFAYHGNVIEQLFMAPQSRGAV
jgi:hypothetical protein